MIDVHVSEKMFWVLHDGFVTGFLDKHWQELGFPSEEVYCEYYRLIVDTLAPWIRRKEWISGKEGSCVLHFPDEARHMLENGLLVAVPPVISKAPKDDQPKLKEELRRLYVKMEIAVLAYTGKEGPWFFLDGIEYQPNPRYNRVKEHKPGVRTYEGDDGITLSFDEPAKGN